MKIETNYICHCDACGVKWGEHAKAFDIDMKENCVCCGEVIGGQCEERYYEQGNYCQKCSNLANEMVSIRKMYDYFDGKKCRNKKCFEGKIKEGKKETKCPICMIKYTDDEREMMFNNLFAKRKRFDLVDSSACRSEKNTFVFKPKKEVSDEEESNPQVINSSDDE
jgi:hypothetical protein